MENLEGIVNDVIVKNDTNYTTMFPTHEKKITAVSQFSAALHPRDLPHSFIKAQVPKPGFMNGLQSTILNSDQPNSYIAHVHLIF